MRLVLLGGSAASTPELFEAIERWPGGVERRPQLTIVLAGRSANKLDLVARACRTRLSGTGRPVVVETATERRRALGGADLVVNQVRIGGLAARDFDESFPWPFGLPGEETMGPGGYANALRTIPALRETWRDLTEIAPDALIVNLTNPAGMVRQAAVREFPLRVIEVCDGPITFLEAIGARLRLPVSAVAQRYVGMNHLGWYVPDAQADLDAIEDLATGMDSGIVPAFQALPTPYVRYYVHPDRLLEAQRGRPTRARTLLEMQARMLSAYEALDAGDMPRRGAVWYAKAVLPVVDAWVNGTDELLILGVANGGLLREVPPEATVEVPHRAARPGTLEALVPVARPGLVAAYLMCHGSYETLAVDAGLSGDRAARLRALLANPMVASYDQAAGLLDAIEQHDGAR
jgi:6-phospho-beta-glucosidase